jgi:DNA-directed RNA polymerase III subunit RPC3
MEADMVRVVTVKTAFTLQHAQSHNIIPPRFSFCQIANEAMLPAKETREKLHTLYKDKYVELFTVNIGKQHNPASMIYLWSFSKPKALRVVSENVCRALCNLRVRRQHEEEVGREFIERAKDGGATDENEHEADKKEYNQFCKGLERLDNAMLQLDETLMVLKDY